MSKRDSTEIPSSACGLYDCDVCAHLATRECVGCRTGNQLFARAGRPTCRLHDCVVAAGLGSCAECKQPSCALGRKVGIVCPLRGVFEKDRWWAGRMSRALGARARTRRAGVDSGVSERVVNRLRWYLTAVEAMADDAINSVSSWQLAEKVGVNAALIRKDLSRFGEFGTPSLGYRVDFLRDSLRRILRIDRAHAIVWIGASCFREQLPAVDRLLARGCCLTGLFDPDPAHVGTNVGGHRVLPIEQMSAALDGRNVRTAALAVSGPQAQEIAEMLVRSGVRAILNLGGQMLVLPDSVRVTSFDLAGELLELCYYCDS